MAVTRSSSYLTDRMIDGKLVVVVGCGSVGSAAALTLLRMGVRTFYLIDNGRVEEVNVGPQMFGMEHLDQPKATALADIMEDFAPHIERVDGETRELTVDYVMGDAGDHELYLDALRYASPEDTFVVLAVDSIEGRRACLAALARARVAHSGAEKYGMIVDTRMGLNTLWMTTLQTHAQQVGYAEELPNDDQVPDAPCTLRTISYTPTLAGAWIGRVFAAWCRGETAPWQIHADMATFMFFTVQQDGKVVYA